MASLLKKAYVVNLSNDFVNYYNDILNDEDSVHGEPGLVFKMTFAQTSEIVGCSIDTESNFEVYLPDLPNCSFQSARFITELNENSKTVLTGKLVIIYGFPGDAQVFPNLDIEILGVTSSDFTNS